jgi:hypothetical protein
MSPSSRHGAACTVAANLGRSLDGLQNLTGKRGRDGVVEDSDASNWRDLRQQFHPFAGNRWGVIAEPSDVTAGMGQARDKALADWVSDDHKYERDRLRSSPQRVDGRLVWARSTSGPSATNSAA